MRRALLLLACVPSLASAEIRPTPSAGDPRIQTVRYDPGEVVQLQVTPGYLLTIEFSADERIETVALGDSNAWQVTPSKRADHLFIKPRQPGITTNMTVVTDARSYSFVLTPAYGPLPDMPFTVRFEYPAPAVAVVDGTPAREPTRYKISGDRAVRPQSIRDDGVHTYITFAPGQTLPAIFAVLPETGEALVNGMMRDGQYVVDSVAPRFVFRIDKQVAVATATRQRRRGS
ncbi:TrbG/VirB9 family P-type conjugative transfer protein [Sphingomonas immobilis]|uniref:TrbG/VirB9 family P-type conjugative transfer protein n=1 Tax=Sphingomonas immobilis TaxID=3063997 RepID=A0ABT8ZZY0_9SPHN|nr:TrbG/VirB9 family P-type conjugative transfer protein [Sphingomonas sp. CA1-15]MDO7843136.1 TrbG/VirB9 family P-type conjugative transfer protein [Sphingomonas sp. CA1-15]